MNFTNKNYYLFFILALFILEAVLFSIGNNKFKLSFLNEENKSAEIQNTLSNISIEAKAVSIYDKTLGKQIYGKSDDIEMPLASLAKVMTVVTALNNHQINDTVTVSLNAIKQEGDYGFVAGEKFNIKDLAEFTLIGSSNDGAYALAENSGEKFLEKMNEKVKKIGAESTLFFNYTGLDIDEGFAGAYASAQDMNLMAIYAYEEYPEVFGASVLPEINIQSESGKNHKIKNTDTILDKIPNILFSKTGFTPLAGGNLTIIYQNKYGHEIVITVLGSSENGRFKDVEKIVNTLYDLDYGN